MFRGRIKGGKSYLVFNHTEARGIVNFFYGETKVGMMAKYFFRRGVGASGRE